MEARVSADQRKRLREHLLSVCKESDAKVKEALTSVVRGKLIGKDSLHLLALLAITKDDESQRLINIIVFEKFVILLLNLDWRPEK